VAGPLRGLAGPQGGAWTAHPNPEDTPPSPNIIIPPCEGHTVAVHESVSTRMTDDSLSNSVYTKGKNLARPVQQRKKVSVTDPSSTGTTSRDLWDSQGVKDAAHALEVSFPFPCSKLIPSFM
jgi:hypothetical protein